MSRKGFSFERKVCKELSAWFKDRNSLWRGPASGGWSSKNKSNQVGDIIAMKPEAEILTKSIIWEIKRGYSNQDVLSKILSDNSKIIDFLFKLESLKPDFNKKYCILIYKADYRQTLVFVPEELAKRVKVEKRLILQHPSLKDRYHILVWEEFLSTDPSDFLSFLST